LQALWINAILVNFEGFGSRKAAGENLCTSVLNLMLVLQVEGTLCAGMCFSVAKELKHVLSNNGASIQVRRREAGSKSEQVPTKSMYALCLAAVEAPGGKHLLYAMITGPDGLCSCMV
jgi:hypothetical protein